MVSKMKWFLYVLRCADDSFYAGITTDVERRLYEHNNSKLGAKYTKNKRPVSLICTYDFPDRSTASKAEYHFKKLSRKQKQQILDGSKKGPWEETDSDNG